MAKKRTPAEKPPVGIAEPTPGMLPLLAGIRDAPADDMPRLVFADWLDERGYYTWAELIRVQCELRRAPGQVILRDLERGESLDTFRAIASGDDFRVIHLIERELACLGQPDKLPTFPAARPGYEQVTFDRGLPCVWLQTEGHRASHAAFAAPVEHFAWIDTIFIACSPPSAVPGLDSFLAQPMRWGYVDGLMDWPEVPLARWRRMANLGRLRYLSMSLFPRSKRRAALLEIAQWSLPQLELLRLFVGVGIDDHMAERLADAPWPALTDLELGNTGVTAAGYILLADQMGPRLRTLDVNHDLSLDVLQATCRNGLLLSGGSFPTVEPASECVRVLAACPHAAQISFLDASRTSFGDDDLMHLAQSPHLVHLRKLRLDRTLVTDAGIEAFARTPMMGRLSRLTLSNTCIGDRGIMALAESSLAGRLEELNLDGAQVTDAGAVALLDSPHLGKLWELFIQFIQLSSDVRGRLVERFEKHVYMTP